MPRLPAYRVDKNINESPHVVILGAGASLAALPNGDSDGRRLPLMNSIVSTLGLESLVNGVGLQHLSANFETLYSELLARPTALGARQELEERVRAYFGSLTLPDRVTLYDRLLLSLRDKDIVATFNWDPLILQAAIRLRHVKRLPEILFLHGNVNLGYCEKHRVTDLQGRLCGHCKRLLTPSPILFPVTQKDYTSNPFIAAAWEGLRAYLDRAFILTIFGYSAPTTDLEAKDLLMKAWDGNQTREVAEVEVIDIRPRKDLFSTWSPFIVRQHYGIHRLASHSLSFHYPRRSCEGLAWAILQNDPWPQRPLPSFRRLDHLVDWVWPLIEEELRYEADGTPFSRMLSG